MMPELPAAYAGTEFVVDCHGSIAYVTYWEYRPNVLSKILGWVKTANNKEAINQAKLDLYWS